MELLSDVGPRIAGALFFVIVLGMYLLGPILALFALYFGFKVFRKVNTWAEKR
jgi:hypothetical protein